MAAQLNLARRAVLTDMAYELGGAGLEQFHHFLAACREGDWTKAGLELKASLLYSQVPGREEHNCAILVSGELSPLCPDARSLIKLHEGLNLEPKPDAKGKWVVGWGHDMRAPEPGEVLAPCTLAEASAWFDHDFVLAQARARRAVGAEVWGSEGELG